MKHVYHLFDRYDDYLYLEQSEITNRNSPIITSRGQHTTSQPAQYNIAHKVMKRSRMAIHGTP